MSYEARREDRPARGHAGAGQPGGPARALALSCSSPQRSVVGYVFCAGGAWERGVIGALGASIVLCFRSSRDGNIVYSFFLLAMLCAIIFQCFQLYATVHVWQLWVRAAPLHTEHTTLRRLTDASQAPELTGCARSPQTTGSEPPAALQPHRAPGLCRNEFNEATSSEASSDRRDRREGGDRVHRRELHVHRVLFRRQPSSHGRSYAARARRDQEMDAYKSRGGPVTNIDGRNLGQKLVF